MSENNEPENQIYLHVCLEQPLVVNVNIYHYSGQPSQPGPAVTAIMKIGEEIVSTTDPANPTDPVTPPQITVDERNKAASIKWVDAMGDTDADAPPNAQVVWSGDDDSVATVDTDTGAIAPVREGMFTLSVAFNDSSTGGSLMLADGVTPFPVPQPTQVQVVAGAAVGAELEIKAVDSSTS